MACQDGQLVGSNRLPRTGRNPEGAVSVFTIRINPGEFGVISRIFG